MSVVTLDTGALIALERRKPRATGLLRAARARGVSLVTITPVITEWWRGRGQDRELIADVIRTVAFPHDVARAAGEALGGLAGGAALTIDVMVVAFAAAQGGQVVYTSDVEDLARIAALCFPAVRVLGI